MFSSLFFRSKLKVICITASNTWGLFLLVLLLGYGLVEVPRTCWHNAKRGHMLQYIYFKASKLSTEKSEAEEVLEDVLDDIQRSADSIREGHALRPYVEVILSKVRQIYLAENIRSIVLILISYVVSDGMEGEPAESSKGLQG